VRRAHALVSDLLRDVPERLEHSRAVGRLARDAADRLLLDDELLSAAGLLHDIGYGGRVVRTGFHPFDGARFLAHSGWPDTVVRLVAHHSHAALIAPYEGLDDEYARLPQVPGLDADVLTWADLTAGLLGQGTTPPRRVSEMRVRHADRRHIPAEVRERRYLMLLAAAERVDRELAATSGRVVG